MNQPLPAPAMFDKAYQALIAGNPETALELAWQLYPRMPGNAAVLKLLGLAYEMKGNAFAGLSCRYLDEAKGKGLDDVDVNIGLARNWLRQEQFAQAHEALNAASRCPDPNASDTIRFHRGLCLVAEQNWQKSSTFFEGLLDSAKFGELATGWLGVIAACQGDSVKALSLLERLPLNSETYTDENYQIFQCHYRDILANQTADLRHKRILILRHPGYQPDFYQVFLDWLVANYPAYRSLFELRLLPCPPLDIDRYALHLPWLQDPVQNWSQQAFQQACALEEQFLQRHIAVINPVSQLDNAGKHEGAARITSAGLRTPHMVKIADIAAFRRDHAGLAFPFFIREDWGHGGSVARIENDRQLELIQIEKFRRPIAVELIDVKSPDGLYRKYRYFAIGDYGISHHLLTTDHWITRGGDRIYNPQTRAEELAFIAVPNPHHALFQLARHALALDFIAFDYAYDHDGRVIVWEANPYPAIRWPRVGGKSEFRVAALHRTLATMLLVYLERAQIDAPPELRQMACYDPAVEDRLIEFGCP